MSDHRQSVTLFNRALSGGPWGQSPTPTALILDLHRVAPKRTDADLITLYRPPVWRGVCGEIKLSARTDI